MSVKGLYIPNLPENISLEDVQIYLSQYGTLRELCFDGDSRNVCVRYSYYYPVTNFQRVLNKDGQVMVVLNEQSFHIYETTASPLPQWNMDLPLATDLRDPYLLAFN